MTEAYGEAFRWTEGGGMQGLGYLRPEGTFSKANGISRDGSTIVGASQSGGPFGGPIEGFVWTEPDGMQELPRLPGATNQSTGARAVSATGDVIVGSASSPNGRSHAVRWTANGIEDIASPFAEFHSTAFAVSDNGDVIGGAVQVGGDFLAFAWTPQTGMVDLRQLLLSHGVAVPTSFLPELVNAVSGDGLTFAGYGLNSITGSREGFVATIPAPASTLVLLLAPVRRRRPQPRRM